MSEIEDTFNAKGWKLLFSPNGILGLNFVVIIGEGMSVVSKDILLNIF